MQAHWDLDNQNWIALDRTHLIGVPKIDQGHLELVNILNDLNIAVMSNKPSEVTTQLLNELATKIRSHFQQEECLMDQYGFFDNDTYKNDDHKKEHKRLIDELEYLKDKFHHGGEMAVVNGGVKRSQLAG